MSSRRSCSDTADVPSHGSRYCLAQLVLLPCTPRSGKIPGRHPSVLLLFSYSQSTDRCSLFSTPPDFRPPLNGVLPWWISRVPETSSAAKTVLAEVDERWQPLSDGSGEYVVRTMELPQGKERWVIVRTHAQVQATQEQMEKKVKKTQQEWEKRLWHLSNQAFACQTDAQNAWKQALKGKPFWLIATFNLKEHKQYLQRVRPKK